MVGHVVLNFGALKQRAAAIGVVEHKLLFIGQSEIHYIPLPGLALKVNVPVHLTTQQAKQRAVGVHNKMTVATQ